MLAQVAVILFPVFALLAAGAASRATGLLSAKFASELNKLVFYGALPCLLVDAISGAEPSAGIGSAALALALATLATFAASWFLAVPLGIPRASRPTFCQAVCRSNDAYVGIPVVALALSGRADAAHGLALATLTLAPGLILYNVLAVLVLSKPGRGASPLGRVAGTAAAMAKNPLILACLAGLVLLLLRVRAGIVLPRPVAKTVQTFGQMATAGSLVALGATLEPSRVKAAFRSACLSSVFKLALCPVFGAAFCALVGLPPMHRFIVILYLACPSAVASFVMAEAMGGDAQLAGATVALTTVLSLFSLSAAILFALPA